MVKIPIAGNREAVQAEVPQAEIYAQLLDKVEGLQETGGSDLQVLHEWQKQPEMGIRTKISYRHLTPLLPRTVESYYALRHERDDLDEAWYFGKRDPLESEDEDDGVSQE